jgi:hypothetical protein
MSVKEFLTEAKTAHDFVIQKTRGLTQKWEKSGLLEGLKGYEKQGMAVMLENQAHQLINEASTTNPAGAGTPGEQWAGVALPLVRKVFGSISAKNFVSVQPMNLPSGLIFYMDFKYNSTRNGQTSGTSLYGNTLSSPFSGFGNTTEGGLYGSGRYGYSINDAVVAITPVNSGSAITDLADINYNSEFSASLSNFRKFTVPAASASNADNLAFRAFIPSGSGNISALVIPEFTKFDGTNYTFILNTGGATTGSITGLFYVKQPTDTTRGDFEDRTGGPVDRDTDIGIPQIDLELKSETIVARTRKLKAVWSPELAQDLNAYHSIDAEAELTAMLSDYVAMEIDLEILDMLEAAAPTAHTEFWSTTIGRVWEGNGFVNDTNISGQAWTNMTWFQTLGQKMQKLSNKIHQATMRGGANFAVVSPSVATILETIPGFQAGTDGDKAEFAAGVSKIGSFANRFTVYKNPYMKSNVMLMGFRGSQFLETGAVYAPYIPLLMTPLVYDPNNFTPRRGVMTRYAKKIVRPEFFGKILIEGVNKL